MAGSMLVAVEGMVSWVAIQCLTTKMKCQNQQFYGDRMGLCIMGKHSFHGLICDLLKKHI